MTRQIKKLTYRHFCSKIPVFYTKHPVFFLFVFIFLSLRFFEADREEANSHARGQRETIEDEIVLSARQPKRAISERTNKDVWEGDHQDMCSAHICVDTGA